RVVPLAPTPIAGSALLVPTCPPKIVVERRMDNSADELRAILSAYQEVAAASWPDLNPDMKSRSSRWSSASAGELRAELDGYLREVAPPRSNVRVMWKTGPKYQFGGCNELFAKDSGLASSELIGIDDFDKRLPW